MKKYNPILLLITLLMIIGCEQELVEVTDPEPNLTNIAPDPCDGASGSADFTKFIAIGNSFVAGVQGGALFTTGQNNSLAAIIHNQLKCAGGSATFNQPDINATLGYNLFISPNPGADSKVLGRLLLQYGDNVSCATGQPSPLPTAQAYGVGELEAVPNPSLNPGFIYDGTTSELNNFAVPAITIGQTLISAAGNWADPNPAIGFTPFYARFASVPGTSTILSDAATSGGTFALVWLGLDDFFLHAAFGADPSLAPLTSSGDFATRLGAIFAHPSIGLFTVNTEMKAVIGNFPDIFKMPHFTSVAYNPIPLDQATVDQLTAGFAGYNSALDALIANKVALGISDDLAAEIDTRRVAFTAGCNNKIMLIDETLTDLGPYFDNLGLTAPQRAGLVPYEQIRQTTSADVIPLSTGSVLGEDGSFGVLGVSEPVGDRYVIIPSEKDEINAARTAFNATIDATVANFSTKLALADVSTAMATLITNGAGVYNGVTITPNINPPTGIYSEDGVHPNTRGYAFLSRIFINAINEEFGATIPLTNLSKYSATALPIP